jgi:murein L,D-transpeptidase YcbB/YkuD
MVPALLKSGGDLRPAIMKLAPGIVAATAVALYSALSIHLTGTLTPWTKRDADLVTSALPSLAPASPPSPALAALRKNLTELAGRSNVAPAYAEDLAGATAFYGAHSGPLLWVAESGISERGNAVIAEIRKADDWGLRARDFALPQLPAGANSPEAAAAAEVELTFAVLKYARFARGGRFSDPSSISKLLDYTPPVHAPKDVLADIAASDAPDAYLRSLHPRHAQFEALRRLLLKLRRPGAGDGEIAYGEKLQTVLPQFVRAEASDVDAASSVEPGRESAQRTLKIGRILVNMERWRWLPADLGEFHVWNNVPEFLTRVVRKGEVIHSDRIVAGQPEWPTPAFSADMKMIVFHPSWGVPDGIKRKELWPLLRNSSGGDLIGLFTGSQSSRAVLEQHKLQAYYQGRPIDPNQVDWSSANIGAYDFRQPPGPANVLGAIKFMFPNKHDVYMHDTPQRDLFARPFRGLSHGCMRVENPSRLAGVLLAQDKGWSEQQVASLLNGGTREVELTTRVPVHMTYFTAMVDREGNLRTFGDLYGVDTRMGALLLGKKVPFVTPRYDAELMAMGARQRPAEASGAPGLSTLADAISNIFSP